MKYTVMSFPIKRAGYTLSLLTIGYLIGLSGSLIPSESVAQPASGNANENKAAVKIDLSNEAIQKVQAAQEALAQAMEVMNLDGKYTPATEGVNPYLLLTGGGDAIDDLKQGNGVDPVTFSALYAGLATQEVEDDLSWDDKNRLMYKNKLVRIYSVEKLKKRELVYKSILEKRIAVQ